MSNHLLALNAKDMLGALERLYFRHPPSRGVLSRVDARVKLVATLAVVIALTAVTSWKLLLGAVCALTAAAALSGVPLRTFAGRVFLVVPLFTVVIITPSVFNFITPGDPILCIGAWAVTREGLTLAATFTLRVVAALSAVTLLVMTTPWHRLLGALRLPGLPGFFTLVLLMTYRYIHLLLTWAVELVQGVASRSCGALPPGRARAVVARHILSIFLLSRRLSDDVYDAMRSRGWRSI